MKYLLLLCLLTGFISLSTALEGPLVHTKLGALRGEYLRVRGKTTVIHSYLGVPFAKPPVGALRLAPPQPVQGWEGVRDATKQPFMCIQDRQISIDALEVFSMISEIPEVSEDCLYLNIYTPVKPAEDAKLPVMVWIHGGGFFMGSASSYDGSVLAAYQNVVVVLIQYRLGMLGFLSTGDDNAPGNMGLLDQVAALQWVQENIQSFGGDPSSVTIFGESAGGVSVSLQMLSPLSSGLFHRAIAQSGTAAMDLLVTTDSSGVAMVTTIFAISWLLPMPPNTPPPQLYQMMANASGCAGTKPHEIVDCVMKMSTEDVIEIAKRLDILFMVCVDGHFLPKPVDDLIKSHKFSKVPLINGINSDEGGYGLTEFMAPPDWKEGMDADAVKQSIMPLLFQFGDSEVIDFIVEGYLGDGKDRVKNRDAFRDLCADVMFNMPGIKLSNAHRDSGASVYMYELQHPPSILSSKRPSFVKADHGDDIIFVFGGCFFKAHIKMNGSLTEEEDELCRTIMSYWGNFARTGFPNGPGLTHWPMYGSGEEYLGIGLKQQVGTHLKAERFTFMTETLPKKIQEIQQQQEQKHEMQQQQQQQKQEMQQQQQQRHSDEL